MAGKELIESKLEKERIRLAVLKLYFQEMKLKKIQDSLIFDGQKLSINKISRIITDSISEWKKQEVVKISELKGRELAKLESLESEYWKAWNRSLQIQERIVIKTKKIDTGRKTVNDSGNIIQEFIEVETGRTKIKTESSGNAKFLEGIERCIHKRCQILGIMNQLQIGIPDDPGMEYQEIPLSEVHKRLISIFNIQVNNYAENNS